MIRMLPVVALAMLFAHSAHAQSIDGIDINKPRPAVLLRTASGDVAAASLLKRAAQDDPPIPGPSDAYWECVYNCQADADSQKFIYCNNIDYDQNFYCEQAFDNQAQDCQSQCVY